MSKNSLNGRPPLQLVGHKLVAKATTVA